MRASASRRRLVGFDEHAIHARLHELRDAAHAAGDDRQSRSHSFEDAIGSGLGSRWQHEDVACREQRRHVVPFAGKVEGASSPISATLCRSGVAERPATDNQKAHIRMSGENTRGCRDEGVVSFLLAEVRDNYDPAQ